MAIAMSGRSGAWALFARGVLALLPCVVSDGWRVWPIAVWVVGCIVRLECGDSQVTTDCFIFGGLYVWLSRERLLETAVKRWNEVTTVGATTSSFSLLLVVSVTIVLAIAGLAVWRVQGKSRALPDIPPTARTWTLDHPKAKIFPCRTTHARMFPKKHAFNYSYLQCGFPIIPDATTIEGMDVSNGKDREMGKWWLRVKAEDYLSPGNGELGFYGKLKMHLREHVKFCHALFRPSNQSTNKHSM